MAIPSGILDREFKKFIESPTRPDQSAIEVVGNFTSSPGPFAPPSNTVTYTYSTTTDGIYFVEVYQFYSGGTPVAPTGLLKTISLYYTDSAFTNEVGGVWS